MASNKASSINLNLNLDEETISKIIHRIGHDIGNPLTSIISLASIIEKFSDPSFNSLDPAKLSSYAGTISSEAWKISRLSETLVQTLSKKKIQTQVVNLDEIIDRALSKVESQSIKYPDIVTELDTPENMTVLADPDQLTFALVEIIRNSFQANIEFDTNLINIDAEQVGDYCKISCSNKLSMPLEVSVDQLFLPLIANFKKISSNVLDVSLNNLAAF